jgi:hypothetical protein
MHRAQLRVWTLGFCLLVFLSVSATAQTPSNNASGGVQAPAPAAGTEKSAAPAPLTNDDVEAMVRAGLDAEIIVAKIRSSPTHFDTSPASLEKLKQDGVPATVILAMVNAGASPSTGAASPAPAAPAATPAAGAPIEVRVPDGTPVEVELKANVSSEAVEEGTIVDLTVVQPVVVNGHTVIDRGAPARARIVEVKKARHWGRAGQLTWAMQDVTAVDGQRLPARFTKAAEGGGSSGKVAGAVVATAIVFWPAAPLWGLHKGHPAVLPAGQRYQVFVHGDAVVKVPATQPLQPAAPAPKQP